jgi:MoaA/NifB/PqqE/SkfB family radical SAM enzyme
MTKLFEKRWKKDFSEMRVVKAEWLITRECDLQCSYCKIRDCSSLQEPELETDELCDIVDIFAEQWPGAPMIVYGGEPTTRKDLPDLLQHGAHRGVKLPVISNSRRILKDPHYAWKLVQCGLTNWSVSFDGFFPDQTVDKTSYLKSASGFRSLIMFRDGFGLRDLVACITVTKRNIDALPYILGVLTSAGIHSIFTPLHVGGNGYEYAQGRPSDLPTLTQIESISEQLRLMVASGRYLCSNDASWFRVWPEHFLRQDWKCRDKGLVTIDADGSLKYCVDIPFRPEDRMYARELRTEEGRQKFLRIIQKEPPCTGCLWNPAYESIKRIRDPDIGEEEGRDRARHRVTEDRLDILYGGAGRFFEGNPDLAPVETEMTPHEALNFATKMAAVFSGELA